MSAVPRHPKDLGHVGLRMTADQFFTLGETDQRLELIDGVIAMSPSPTLTHQEIITELLSQIGGQAAKRGGYRVFPDTDVEFSKGMVYRPDVSVYVTGRVPQRVTRLTAAPDLVIEVLSPGSMPLDLITKRDDYERFGVGEYWAISSTEARFRVWRRSGDQLIEAASALEELAGTAVPGLKIDLRPIRTLIGA